MSPRHAQALPLPPEFVAPQDGAAKQDCKRQAVKRWLARHGARTAALTPPPQHTAVNPQTPETRNGQHNQPK